MNEGLFVKSVEVSDELVFFKEGRGLWDHDNHDAIIFQDASRFKEHFERRTEMDDAVSRKDSIKLTKVIRPRLIDIEFFKVQMIFFFDVDQGVIVGIGDADRLR